MSMEMNSVTSGITTRQTGYTTKVDKNTSNSDAVSKTADKVYSGESATYEKGSIEPKATYSINKMSKEERAALVNQLKADAEQRQSQFLDIVRKTISGLMLLQRPRLRRISEKTDTGALSRLLRGCLILQVRLPEMMQIR